MGEREEDESTADVEDIVGGQAHHQKVEVPLASSATEHQNADGVADEADAEHDQLKNIIIIFILTSSKVSLPVSLPQPKTRTCLQHIHCPPAPAAKCLPAPAASSRHSPEIVSGYSYWLTNAAGMSP